MKRHRLRLILLCGMLFGGSMVDSLVAAEGDPIVSTRQGKLRGKRVAPGILRFAGIPYAQPPLGELRFKPPHPP